MKELTALHRMARILQDYERPIGELMNRVVTLLPNAWQYPHVAAARIRFRGKEYTTKGFRETSWSQNAHFVTHSGEVGSIAVVYLEECPLADEGPFLREERELIESLAEMLRSHLEHLLADQALRDARNSLESQVLARTADLRRLASQLTLAEEKERRRIASDLHDHVGQALAFIKVRVRQFQGDAVFSGFEDAIDEILRLLDQTIQYTRDLTGEISPPVLYELGLEPALDWLAEYFTEKCKFEVRVSTSGRSLTLSDDLAVMVFKSARELLSNSLKHSGEREADLDLTWGNEELTLCVRDKGCGFDAELRVAKVGDRFGLFSLRERFNDLGGGVSITSAPGEGCQVTLTMPVRRQDAK